MNNNMNIIEIEINKLIFPKYNPRKKLKPEDKEYQKIKKSIEEFGYTDLVIINKDNTIISGNQRTQVLMDMGYKKIKVVQIDIDKTKEKALNIALNKITGEWDYAMLGDLLLDLDSQNYDLEITGFDLDEIEGIMAPLGLEEEKEVIEDDFDCTPPEEPKAKYGDIYQLGNHRLMCGDSTKEEDVAKLMNGNKADMVFTDPPYNVAFNGRSGNFEVIKNDNLEEKDFLEFINKTTTIIKKINPLIYYIWCNWKFYGILQEKLEYKSCIVWAKNVFGLGKGYRHQHEFCLFNGKIDENIKNETDLWQVKKDTNYKHPTQKPVELSYRAIGNHSGIRNVVDLFGGSGSTLIACEQLDRNCYMMELDCKYIQVIIERYIAFTGNKVYRLNDDGTKTDWEDIKCEKEK